MARNLYVVLGVPTNASSEEIRKAYYRLARDTHPDTSGSDSAEQFREVQQAWQTLSDPIRRQQYDAELHRKQRPAVATGPTRARLPRDGRATPSLLEDWLADLFASTFPLHGRTSGWPTMHLGLEMTPEEAIHGGELTLPLPVRVRCVRCRGVGRHGHFLCHACRGYGYQLESQTVALVIPAGTPDGAELEVSLGALGLWGMQLVLHVEIPSRWPRGW